MQEKEKNKARVNEVAKAISSGMDRDKIVAKFGKKWQTSPRTIDRYIKKAKIDAGRALDLKMKAEADAAYQLAKETELSRLLDRKEKREILAKIARMELEVERIVFNDEGIPKKIKVKPDLNSVMKAIDIDAKMEGDYAPVKSENTHSFLDFLKETSE